MPNSAVKPFHFERDSQKVLLHLLICLVCLSRLTELARGPVDEEGLRLARHFACCAAASLDQLEEVSRLT